MLYSSRFADKNMNPVCSHENSHWDAFWKKAINRI